MNSVNLRRPYEALLLIGVRRLSHSIKFRSVSKKAERCRVIELGARFKSSFV